MSPPSLLGKCALNGESVPTNVSRNKIETNKSESDAIVNMESHRGNIKSDKNVRINDERAQTNMSSETHTKSTSQTSNKNNNGKENNSNDFNAHDDARSENLRGLDDEDIEMMDGRNNELKGEKEKGEQASNHYKPEYNEYRSKHSLDESETEYFNVIQSPAAKCYHGNK